jgi:hypothetical protein
MQNGARAGGDGVTQVPWTKQPATPAWHYAAVAAGAVTLQAVVLHLMGRVAICSCGYVKLWEGNVTGPGMSQHLTDWYTFSHLLHGFHLYFLLWLTCRRFPIGARFALAVMLESGWEMLENTDFVITRYRADTIALNYYGDSIVNSVSDTLTAAIGFWLAARLRPAATVAVALAIEAGLAFAIRDNLALNIVMLIYDVPWIKAWQAAGQIH